TMGFTRTCLLAFRLGHAPLHSSLQVQLRSAPYSIQLWRFRLWAGLILFPRFHSLWAPPLATTSLHSSITLVLAHPPRTAPGVHRAAVVVGLGLSPLIAQWLLPPLPLPGVVGELVLPSATLCQPTASDFLFFSPHYIYFSLFFLPILSCLLGTPRISCVSF